MDEQTQGNDTNTGAVAEPTRIKAVIGIGNPGIEYEHTYHSAGLFAVDQLRQLWGGKDAPPFKSAKRSFEYCRVRGVVLVKSSVFMNESGRAIRDALHYFGFEPEEVIVLHDDSDLEIGRIKLSWGRGTAGHKGIESIVRTLGTKRLWRARIGIRPPATGRTTVRRKAEDFVLKKIPKNDTRSLTDAIKNAANEIGRKAGITEPA